MTDLFHFLTVPFLLSMFLAINMGGSGTSPSFSAAYGANVIKREFIPGLFGIMVLIGALFSGGKVSSTLGKELLDQSYFTALTTSIILFSVSISLLIANLIGVPQSTSQSTVLSITGAAFAIEKLKFSKLIYEIIPMWFVLPFVSFLIMYACSKFIFPILKRNFFTDDYSRISNHAGLKILLIFSSLFVAFSIGANNVANAAGPIASLTINEVGENSIGNSLPIIILSILIVAPCFAIGSSLLGHKTTKTTGKDIVSISPFQGTLIQLIIASLLLFASLFKGIPTSLVQLSSGAFIALSITKKGIKSTFTNSTVIKFFLVWMIAPVISFLISYALMKAFVA